MSRVTFAIVASGYLLGALTVGSVIVLRHPVRLYHLRMARPSEVKLDGRDITLSGHARALDEVAAIEEILERARSEDDPVILFRPLALKSLSRDRRLLEIAVRCLDSRSSELRHMALERLAWAGDLSVVSALARHFHRGEERTEVIDALKRIAVRETDVTPASAAVVRWIDEGQRRAGETPAPSVAQRP